MDNRSLAVLEYPKIIEILKSYCVSEGGKEMAQKLLPKTETRYITEALATTEECLEMMLRNGRPPLADVGSVRDYTSRAAIGSTLTPGEFLAIGAMLRVTRDMIAYYRSDTQIETLHYVKPLYDSLDPIEPLLKDIERKILSETELADNASRELSRIRREITIKNNRITEKLNGIVSSPANEKYLQDRIVTIRNSRYVVPVKQEYRTQIPGIVLDRSSSGATLFIEPMSVVELNNDLKVLSAEEEKEIARILKEMTEQVACYKIEIEEDYDVLIELDFQYAKGKYGLDIGGNRVIVSNDEKISLLKARHPLLDRKTAVASDIYFDDATDTMIITGPNTGGKTVTLKTIGLINLMAQAGLYAPVGENSKTRPFKQILADIGDEQSIEQSLSTFSSHMTNIVEIMKEADAESLVLFDELGAGTDPTEGAALAIAILNNLHQKGVTSVSTTHYSELKEYALVTAGVINASVEFDVATLKPTYRLLIGIPGKSNAFEIAARLGLPDDIIGDARGYIQGETIRFEETLIAIEEKRKKAESDQQEIARLKAEIVSLKNDISEEARRAEAESANIIEQARNEADEIVKRTKEETELIYQEIRAIQEKTGEKLGDNRELEALRKEISEQEAKISKVSRKKKIKEVAAKKELDLMSLKPGMPVYIKSLHRDGEVLSVLPKEKKVHVQTGNMKMNVKIEDLGKSTVVTSPKKKAVTYSQTSRHDVSPKLDLRGKNSEEALFMVEKKICDAMLAGLHKLTIIHGKGTGKLRQVINEYLKNNPNVVSYALAPPNEGGAGATIVEL